MGRLSELWAGGDRDAGEFAVSVICDYCGEPAEQVTGADIYPHRPDLSHKVFYQCKPCGARVGCHPGGDMPLGRLANAELRRAKNAAHNSFDPLWKSCRMTRSDAYEWLARELGIAKRDCHIGMFDVAMCRRVVEVCRRRNQEESKGHMAKSA